LLLDSLRLLLLGRTGRPADLAELVSVIALSINGSEYVIDGGTVPTG